MSVFAQEMAIASGWELVGRFVVMLGLAGLLGLGARQAGAWLRRWYRSKPK